MGEDFRGRASGLLAQRLPIGLAQGLALYALEETRLLIAPPWFGGLWLLAIFAPVLALGGLGALRRSTFWLWLAAGGAAAAGLGAYDLFVGRWEMDRWPSPQVYGYTAAGLFIAYHLIAAADAERRWRASYARYFDDGWKNGLRLVLAAGFVAALWLLLGLGAALFHEIGLDFLQRLIRKPWFALPATTLGFALAVHLTDVRAGLVRGARTLALTLLSWLLPVMTVIAAGFLLALPFTGLAPLWATGSPAAMMLAAAAALIILINAVYQEGQSGAAPVALRWAVRAAALVLPPLVALAGYGVALRIAQHGLTPDRVYASACLAVGACYAAGYAWASVSRGPWMRRLEATNFLAAHVIVATLLAIFSPLLDPARLSVNDQLRRLESGRIGPDEMDYAFLRWDAGRWGREALKQLAAEKDGPRQNQIAAQASAALQAKERFGPAAVPVARRAAAIHAVGGPLPADFVDQVARTAEARASACALAREGCSAAAVDLDADGALEVVLFGPQFNAAFGLRDGRWREVGVLWPGFGPDAGDLKAGRIRPVAPKWRDVEVGGTRFRFLEAGDEPAVYPVPVRPPRAD